MADSSVAVTPGVGANVDTFAVSGGDHQQVVREARATAETDGTWTVTTAGTSNVIAADAGRVGVLLTSYANGRVWVRFDATIPTTQALSATYLDPGDRYEVPYWLSTLAISLAGQAAGGQINYHLGTAA